MKSPQPPIMKSTLLEMIANTLCWLNLSLVGKDHENSRDKLQDAKQYIKGGDYYFADGGYSRFNLGEEDGMYYFNLHDNSRKEVRLRWEDDDVKSTRKMLLTATVYFLTWFATTEDK